MFMGDFLVIDMRLFNFNKKGNIMLMANNTIRKFTFNLNFRHV